MINLKFPMLPLGYRWRVKKTSDSPKVRIWIEHSFFLARWWAFLKAGFGSDVFPQQRFADPANANEFRHEAKFVHANFLENYHSPRLAENWERDLTHWEDWHE